MTDTMEFEFVFTILIAVVVAYFPGYLVGRSLGLTRITSLSLSTPILFFMILILGVVFDKLSISLPGVAFVGIITGISLLLWVIMLVARKRHSRKAAVAKSAAGENDESGEKAIAKSVVQASSAAVVGTSLEAPVPDAVREKSSERMLILDAELSPSDLYSEWVLTQDGQDEHCAKKKACMYSENGRTKLQESGVAYAVLDAMRIGVKDSRRNAIVLGVYILIGIIMTAFVFLAALDTPESFGHFDDNTAHYNYIRAFLETQQYSILNVNGFIGGDTEGYFYPALWHIFTTFVASISNASVLMAFNASVFVFTAVILPISWFSLLVTLFPRRIDVLVAGSLCCVAFGAFPWSFLVFGQLVSNMAAFAMIPATVAFFIWLVCSRLSVGRRLLYAFVLVMCFGGLAGAQPNAVFTTGLFCAFWLAYYLMRVIDMKCDVKNVFAVQVIVFIVLVAVVCGVWAFFYHASFMQEVLSKNWAAYGGLGHAFFRAIALMTGSRLDPQLFLGLLVLVGLIGSLRIKGYRWMGALYIFGFVLYLVDAGTESALKNVLTGFWYTDPYRIGAMLALFATPLAALGLANTVRFLARIFGKASKRQSVAEELGADETVGRHVDATEILRGAAKERIKKRWSAYVLSAIVVVLVLVVSLIHPFQYMLPNGHTYKSGLQRIQNQLIERYSWTDDKYGLNGAQFAFLQQVSAVVPEDELILNTPNDGTGWAYGVEGLNVNWRGFKKDRAVIPSELLRLHLADMATREDVLRSVKDEGFSYLLRLDEGVEASSKLRSKNYRYHSEDWEGIESVTDNTPGFEVVLADGDMRLYKIEDQD